MRTARRQRGANNRQAGAGIAASRPLQVDVWAVFLYRRGPLHPAWLARSWGPGAPLRSLRDLSSSIRVITRACRLLDAARVLCPSRAFHTQHFRVLDPQHLWALVIPSTSARRPDAARVLCPFRALHTQHFGALGTLNFTCGSGPVHRGSGLSLRAFHTQHLGVLDHPAPQRSYLCLLTR